MKKVRLFVSALVMTAMSYNAYALNAEEIYKKVNKSVYTIYTVNFYDKSPESLGSAIAVTDHILATNCHVALTGNYLGIVIEKEFKLGTIFFRDVNRDICFVEVPGVKFEPVKIRSSQDVKVGEQVYAVGNPEGLEKSISQGIISNKRKDRGGYILQTDASVSFGSSGGGLFDQQGQLVGITNSVDRHSKNIAFALPTEWITQILFPKVLANAKETTQAAPSSPENPKAIKKIGTYGKGNLTLYQYNQKCFVLLTGKNEFGEAAGSAIWYPEKPGIILIFPNSTNLTKNFQIMNTAFYGDQDQSPSYSKNFLFFDKKKYELVGVRDENSRYPLLVTKLPEDTKNKLLQSSNFEIKYEDGMTVQGYAKTAYSLEGFKEAIEAYDQNCKVNKPSETPATEKK
ncbi:MAG: trypsin-like peptidase domain-containing protein [Gammaproteobacteria bacterium]|nr:trypsin-like peptidase domain-containing protein [Gammaproteobacteria bacterium]